MKTCSRCKEEKNYDGFYKDKSTKDGYNCICKQCRLINDRNRRIEDPEWVQRRKLQNSEFHKNNSKEISERKKLWINSDEGKKSHLRSVQKYRKAHPEKRYAHDAVYRAVKNGELIKPEHCQSCNQVTKVEAHHFNYDKEKRTSISWLCKSCHEKITRS